ncbi:MAG: hypothetical protein II776_06095 [Clostridia bacterium]|nr:hypothetical protein [Clostridia bacterium]
MDKTKIYGITFDERDPVGGEKRVFDAAGLENDYTVGETFQKNGGRNDFDDAYPFGAMRLCCVKMVNGEKKVIYADQPGFSRDGSAGNVMVEIPKFYALRKKEGRVETWAVSGTPHSGFALEPAFLRGGKELDAVYVGVYNAAARNGVFSSSGPLPDIGKGSAEYRPEITSTGFDTYDLAIHLMLQRLMVIEMGSRQLKPMLGGVNFLTYFSGKGERLRILSTDKNLIRVLPYHRLRYFAPGHEVGLGHTEHVTPLHRTVEEIRSEPDAILIRYGGEDVSDQLVIGEDCAFGMPQPGGQSDVLTYHTGRVDLRPNLLTIEERNTFGPLVCPFRYRWIENVWGNMWENLAGLKVCGLRYRYTFDPDQYDSDSAAWAEAPFPAPEQPYLANKAEKIWTEEMGRDPASPLLMLPASLHENNVADRYYTGAFYAYGKINYSGDPVDPDRVWSVAVGSGFDHTIFGSLFTYRCFLTETSRGWLYGDRVCLRKA